MIIYKVDVTLYQDANSISGYPLTTDTESEAECAFEAAVAEQMGRACGTYSISLMACSDKGETAIRSQLVNSTRESPS